MAYHGASGGGRSGYGQGPPYYYDQSLQQTQRPYEANSAMRPILPYQASLAQDSNLNGGARQANSFAPAMSFPTPIPSYPTSQYPLEESAWANTARARTHSNQAFSQPAPKRQRIEPSQYQYSGLQQAQPQYQQHHSRQAQMSHPPQPSYTSSPARPLLSLASNTSTRVNQHIAQPKSLEPEAQYKVLLPLAEEFFEAAYALGPSVAMRPTPETTGTYERLIATGLSCLEGALKLRMPPRLEAKVRIRYTSVLYSDTTNDMEAEVALSKGITLCERNRFFDLKYHMQYILAKVMYRKSPKAAFNSLDAHVEDALAYKHYSWVYAFRFLRAYLSFESGSSTDAHAGMQHLHAIADLAQRREDRAIFLASALFQARAHFQTGSPESVERIQRAIAGAWTYQLDEESQIPQLVAMTHVLDVSCSLLKGIPTETVEKMKNLRLKIDAFLHEPSWGDSDDQIAIPIHGNQGHPQAVTSDTRAVLNISEDGTERLMLSWFDKRSIVAISYLLGGITFLYKDSFDRRAEKYFREGLQVFSGQPRNAAGSAFEWQSQHEWRETILHYFHIYLAFYHAARTEWCKVEASLKMLRSATSTRCIPIDGPLSLIIDYLHGVYLQGTGDLEGAVQIFENDDFSIRKPRQVVSSADQVRQDLALLAAMNALWIHQEPSRLDPVRSSSILETLEPLCRANRNEDFLTALHLLKATVRTDPPTTSLKVKNHLVEAMKTAQRTSNTQLSCICLSVMSHRFFTNIVGIQAEKSSRAAAYQAKRTGNKLWMSVTDGMLASCLEIQQQLPEAEKSRERANEWAKKALT